MPDMQQGGEMDVIAACVIGGVSMSGGRGTVLGALLGSLILATIAKALPLIPFFDQLWLNTIKGVIILVVVVVNIVLQRQLTKCIKGKGDVIMAGKSGRSINNVPKSPVKQMIFSWEGILVLLFIAVNIFCANFSEFYNLKSLLRQMPVYLAEIFLMLPMAYILVLGEIDISVGSIVCLSATMACIVANTGAPFLVVILATLLVGSLCGAVNAFCPYQIRRTASNDRNTCNPDYFQRYCRNRSWKWWKYFRNKHRRLCCTWRKSRTCSLHSFPWF